ncbi:sulfite reductase [Bordetella ansorpii]|uniref:Sulfite reductase n=1 Tax=Bordetella ansorpii TaxID=288768 RepID=A0A157QV54_9BORD|nr:PepSY-associated TM helix domain-containing protein [Bordetella ansorpii]SAI49597.1 sulfite reductase [Bordetella ansorpii]
MQARLRALWLTCHRWTALTLGWLLIVAGLTGALLVVTRPLDEWIHPEYFVAQGILAQGIPARGNPTQEDPAGSRVVQGGLTSGMVAHANAPSVGAGGRIVSLDTVRQAIQAEFGTATAMTFRPPREPHETLQVLVRGTWRGTLYLDPSTGIEQGRRGEDEGFVNTLFRLHSALLMETTGKAILAWAALAYLLLLITGLVLWWPKHWPPKLRIELRKGLLRGLFDVHRTGGAVLGLVLAVSVATGAFMAWRPIGGWINALVGSTPVAMPTLRGDPAPSLPLDTLVERAQAVYPDGLVGYVMLAAQPNRPVRIRMRLADEPHPNGVSTIWMDPRDGTILSAQRWNELDTAGRLNAFIYPLHTGELGGVPLQIVTALAGWLLGILGISGAWLWWRRRPLRRNAAI